MEFLGVSANTAPISAIACAGEVIIRARGTLACDLAFSPEAILASLDGLRAAAEAAKAQRG